MQMNIRYNISCEIKARLDHQPLFGKGARAPPPKTLGGTQTRHERAPEIEPKLKPEKNIMFYVLGDLTILD